QSPADKEALTPAPDFSLVDADGNRVLLSDYFGKPIVLNFWASWCPPCKAELPDFETVWAELGGEISFLMVNATDGKRETEEIARAFLADAGYAFPAFYDSEQEGVMAYGVSSLPRTLFIDKDGNLAGGANSMIDEETLRRGIALIAPTEAAEYHKLSAEEAKAAMDASPAFTLLDVRTQAEFEEAHIALAHLLPDTELAERASVELPDKNAPIYVYCRSGRRSESAAKKLVELGYTAVYDFGGIVDWPYETVSGS
ncbi:MAG: redoxin domain-containing protein, partial [Ruthenibacterium sp.]